MHQRKDELQCEVIPTATAPDMHLIEVQEATLAGGRAAVRVADLVGDPRTQTPIVVDERPCERSAESLHEWAHGRATL